MNKIKKYIENQFELNTIEYSDHKCDYLLTPEFVIIKEFTEDEYLISFEIDSSKEVSLNLYIEIQNHFINEFYFRVYEDVIMNIDEFGKIKYFVFGDDAKTIYYNKISEIVEAQVSIMKDTVFH